MNGILKTRAEICFRTTCTIFLFPNTITAFWCFPVGHDYGTFSLVISEAVVVMKVSAHSPSLLQLEVSHDTLTLGDTDRDTLILLLLGFA